MIADGAWSLDAVRRNVPPMALASGFLGDTRKTRETLDRLHQLSERNEDIRITPCHCPERAAETSEFQNEGETESAMSFHAEPAKSDNAA